MIRRGSDSSGIGAAAEAVKGRRVNLVQSVSGGGESILKKSSAAPSPAAASPPPSSARSTSSQASFGPVVVFDICIFAVSTTDNTDRHLLFPCRERRSPLPRPERRRPWLLRLLLPALPSRTLPPERLSRPPRRPQPPPPLRPSCALTRARRASRPARRAAAIPATRARPPQPPMQQHQVVVNRNRFFTETPKLYFDQN